MTKLYHVTLRERPSGGAQLDDAEVPLPVSNRKSKRLVLLVHGFNTNKREALAVFDRLAAHLAEIAPSVQDDLLAVYWPGDWSMPALVRPFAYASAVRRAKESAPLLARFLRDFQADRETGTTFTIVAHSLGCRLVLEALAELAADPMNIGRNPLSLVMLMAAAVPVTEVSGGSRLGCGLPGSARSVVLFSGADLVLKSAFPIGQMAAEGRQNGALPTAVGLTGEPNNTWSSRTEMRGFGHGDYWSHRVVARRLALELGELARGGPVPAPPLPAYAIASREAPARRRPVPFRPALGRW